MRTAASSGLRPCKSDAEFNPTANCDLRAHRHWLGRCGTYRAALVAPQLSATRAVAAVNRGDPSRVSVNLVRPHEITDQHNPYSSNSKQGQKQYRD